MSIQYRQVLAIACLDSKLKHLTFDLNNLFVMSELGLLCVCECWVLGGISGGWLSPRPLGDKSMLPDRVNGIDLVLEHAIRCSSPARRRRVVIIQIRQCYN